MRIIAGEFRGRLLQEPKFEVTRPITDRVKQSLFDVLNPLIENTTVYDCFCGSGSMGLECLSRGAKHVTFFDADRSALGALKTNIKALEVEDRCTVLAGDIFRLLPVNSIERADLIFFDPPYRFLTEKSEPLCALAGQLGHAHLAADGILIFRHDKKDQLTLPGFEIAQVRDYGGMTVELLRYNPQANATDSANSAL